MTTAQRPLPLLAAAQQRHHDARRRATEALRRLDSTGEPINFAAVAEAAGVSRAWLYRQPDLRTEIEGVRQPRRPTDHAHRPYAERATPESVHQQLAALRTLEAQLRADNQRLREALARKLGQERADAR